MPASKKSIGRRTFIGGTATAGVGLALAPRIATGVLGANERVVMGIIGSGGMGSGHMNNLRQKGVEWAAVCDVYEPNRNKGISIAKRANPNEVKGYNEHEKLLERKDIDAVLIASPEHWHHNHLIDAVRAGKDAYSEKPMSWSIEEAANMVREVRKTDRIVQIGMQRRSAPACFEAKEIIDSGALGSVFYVRAEWYWNYAKKFRGSVDKGKLDWNRFCGPGRADEAYTPAKYDTWRYFWTFSGGNVTDQGVHLMDVIQWFMDSPQVVSANQFGEVYRTEPCETPDVFSCTMEYPKYMATWTLCYTNSTWRNSWHITFHGDKATLAINEAGWRLCDKVSDWKDGMPKAKKENMPGGVTSTGPHHDNFLQCVKSRTQPNATVEKGFQAVRTLHLANIALHKRRQASLSADGVTVTT